MRVNKKLIKYNNNFVKISRNNFKDIKILKTISVIHPSPISIIIPLSIDRLRELKICLHYLNLCRSIGICEILIILYQNKYEEIDLSEFKNIKYKIIWSKRNNDKNIFCLSHARNIGIMNAKHDWLLFLDGDIIVPEELILSLSHDIIRNNTNILYFTERHNIDNHHGYKCFNDLKNHVVSVNNEFTGFFQFFNKKTAIDNIGGYSEEMLGFGREDCCLLSRWRMAGLNLRNLKSLFHVYHINHQYNTQEWKTEDSDKINHMIQDKNIKNKKIKMENIGKIIQ